MLECEIEERCVEEGESSVPLERQRERERERETVREPQAPGAVGEGEEIRLG